MVNELTVAIYKIDFFYESEIRLSTGKVLASFSALNPEEAEAKARAWVKNMREKPPITGPLVKEFTV